jgi:hypothetical protein
VCGYVCKLEKICVGLGRENLYVKKCKGAGMASPKLLNPKLLIPKLLVPKPRISKLLFPELLASKLFVSKLLVHKLLSHRQLILCIISPYLLKGLWQKFVFGKERYSMVGKSKNRRRTTNGFKFFYNNSTYKINLLKPPCFKEIERKCLKYADMVSGWLSLLLLFSIGC